MLTFRSLPSVIVHSFVIAHHYSLLPRGASASSLTTTTTTTTTTLPTDEHGDYNGADLIDVSVLAFPFTLLLCAHFNVRNSTPPIILSHLRAPPCDNKQYYVYVLAAMVLYQITTVPK
jgi:hypothetical protein